MGSGARHMCMRPELRRAYDPDHVILCDDGPEIPLSPPPAPSEETGDLSPLDPYHPYHSLLLHIPSLPT